MGTRHLICAVKDGQYRIAQYGQFDGYPAAQGDRIVSFLLSDRFQSEHDRFLANLGRARFASVDEIRGAWLAAGADPSSDLVSMDVAAKFRQSNPQLARECGAGVLDYVLNCESPMLQSSVEFAVDSLFCEWAYVIDFDREALEVYKGFNKSPVDAAQRFADIAPEAGSGYFQVRKIAEFPFASLTAGTMDELEASINKERESATG